MNQYLTYAAIAVGLLFVSLLIPGLKILAEAIIKVFLEFFIELLKNKATFVVWFVKTLFSDHFRIIKHATTSRDVIDPTQRVRRKAEGYED